MVKNAGRQKTEEGRSLQCLQMKVVERRGSGKVRRIVCSRTIGKRWRLETYDKQIERSSKRENSIRNSRGSNTVVGCLIIKTKEENQ